MTAKISISIPDASLVKWLRQRARREGKSASAVASEILDHKRRLEALSSFLEWAGAPELTPEREAEIRAEIEGSVPARAKRRRSPRRRKRAA